MKSPRFKLSTLCMAVLIVALLLGLVVTMVRQHYEMPPTRTLARPQS
jgi:hypothetical protein